MVRYRSKGTYILMSINLSSINILGIAEFLSASTFLDFLKMTTKNNSVNTANFTIHYVTEADKDEFLR